MVEAVVVIVAVVLVFRLVEPAEDGARANPANPDIEGFAHVVDGDSLRIGGQRIRLHGVDAFEADQVCQREDGSWACGQAATNHMRTLAQGRQIACEVRDIDRYGRSVAVCAVDGQDLGRAMVTEGLAVAYHRYSMAYAGDELAARQQRAGAWQGSFDRPEQWRRHDRRNGAAN